MTETRKIQLATEVDASGATQGFEKVKQGAREMAVAVTQAGQQAGKGLDGVADGAKRAADGFTREEGRMRGAIQRATLDLKTLGAAASDKLQAKIEIQGLDTAKFAPYLAALREVEQAQRALQAKQTAAAFTDGLQLQIVQLQEQIRLQSMSADEVLRYKAAQAGAADAAEPLIAKLRELQRAQESVTEAARATAAAQKEAAAVANRQTAFIDGLKQQADAIGKTRADLLELQAAQLGITSQAAPYISRLREAERGHQAFAAGAKLNTFQLQQLGFQMHDFGVQVLSGQNALVAFVQQGSQLSGTFGGAGNALRAITSLITPMRAAMLGGAAAVGGLALALSHAETAARGLNTVQAQLSGTGRRNLFVGGELKEFLNQLSEAPDVSRETATQIVSELSKVRDIGGGIFRDLAGMTADYAKAAGTDIPTAARTLARAFADPEKGAKQLDEALGALSSSQLLQIERLSRLGDTAGAQRVLFDALQGSIKGLADNALTPLQKATNDLGNSWERAMRALDQSQGLRTINELLAKTVNAVQFLVDNVDKLGGLGNIAASGIPGIGPASSVGRAISAQFGPSVLERVMGSQSGAATGSWEGPKPAPGATPTGAPSASTAAAGAAGAGDDEIKRALGAAGAYRSQAGQIEELTAQRKQFNDALQQSIALYGKESEQAKRLREAIAGVNERIASIAKKNRNTEPDQIARAELEGQVRAVRDALTAEREALSFQERFLQGAYQAGESSLAEYFDRKRAAIERGVQAEIAALDQEIAALQAYQAKVAKKDPSAAVQAGERIEDALREQERLRNRASNEVALANQQQEASFRQLNDQVLAYRANLLQLQGDEEGAARLRAQQAIEQAQILARQAGGGVDVQGLRQAGDQNLTLTTTRRQVSEVQTRLQMREERIAQDQRAGGITTLESLAAVSDGRRKAVAELEELVRAQEEVAKTRPKDYQLQIDTERARHELELLKGELDPLQEQFRNLFTDAGTDFLTSLMEGKGIKGALKAFGEMVGREINGVVGRELSEQLFGKNGALGGAGGFLADIFGGEARKKGADPVSKAVAAASGAPQIDTAPAQASLNTLARAGADPAAQALTRLATAADAAAASLQQRAPLPPGIQDIAIGAPAVAGVVVNPTTGDFARMDRGQVPAGEQSVMDLFKDAETSSADFAKTSALASQAVTQLAAAAGKGGGALSLLPSIISAIQASAAASSASSGGSGGVIGQIIGAFAGGGSAAGSTAGFFNEAGAYELAGSLGFSDGGFTGAKGEKEVAGVVHGQEYVFSAAAVRAIGVDRLERIHTKAKTGQEVDEELPGYSDGGYVGVLGTRPRAASGGSQYLVAMPPAKSGDTYVTNNTYPVTVQATPGMTKQTALQTGREVGRGIELARARNGR